MDIKAIKKKIVPILKRQGVTKAALFGSVARGEANKKSDIDLLVNLERGKTLFDLVGLELDLRKRTGKKVDVITYDGIHPFLRDRILGEQKIIYERRRKG